ncbi:hypothetical protein [Bacillus anthracis]|uniref:hypothetical protein n=1 Tax=Bacillus anthracis TaxID=1392 RepID=UPI002B4BD6EB|nr:hypothetical protein [Bacillus anthracis]
MSRRYGRRKKYDCDCHCEPRYQAYTSGPLFRNADTDFIQVSALNQTDVYSNVKTKFKGEKS